MLPFPVDYQPYDLTHVISQLQLLFFSALAFTWLKLSGLYPPELPLVNLDAEWVYRRLVPRFIRKAATVGRPLETGLRRSVMRRIETVLEALFRYHGPQGVLARTWATGSMVLWVAILLVVYLIFYYS